nr:TetR family transcriptional regulator [Acidimicrobiia bacterium]
MARRIRDPESRERIVDAAARVVAELGLRGATVRAIAAEAGVSTGYVMHYFPDKAALTDAVLDRTNRRAGARVEAAVRAQDSALASAIEALLPLDAERRLEWRVWAAFWTATPAGGGGPALVGARN